MRAEEKEVADFELARETRTDEVREADVEQLPELELATDLALEHRTELVGAIRDMLANKTVDLAQLALPDRERIALDYLHAAMSGRDPRYKKFAYADDRRDMLEQALAVIAPVLGEQVAELEDITRAVADLRVQLTQLGDAQDELLIDAEVLAVNTIDTTDKPAPLDGQPLPERVKQPSTLTGPAIAEPAPPPTTLTGPAVPDMPPPPTTLTGAPLPETKKSATTLVGTDAPVAQKGSTTLVDPTDPPKAPWWRRPFG